MTVGVGVGVDKYDGKGRGEVTVGVGVDKYDGKGGRGVTVGVGVDKNDGISGGKWEYLSAGGWWK